MNTRSLISLLLSLAAAFGLASCQTTTGSNEPTEAVTCSKCQMVAYKKVGFGINKQIEVLSGKTMTCPECKSIAQNFFSKSASLKHTCSACGGELAHCVAH
ncbi:hypothetical protein DES53_112193 [Roseimicrobium gellanilyticum]|uniref:Uncharacterized protein n=1 Tax=Roseimicrobium gellanilyticum TaxID=748857 RepID=A0A366H825_9BACT|nr:hypothetical protein [Roseimicrobium gellanilyticum]RBP38195.1 hypothetical protein DES53_112193 [Roseimicrobium gellanilyticum]